MYTKNYTKLTMMIKCQPAQNKLQQLQIHQYITNINNAYNTALWFTK